MAAPSPGTPALPVKNKALLTLAVMGASVIQFLDATIANVAIPHMQTSLNASLDTVTWVLTSFIIASAIATPIVGWLADRVGSRTLFLWAVTGFLVSSMLCGAAAGLGQMVAFRILQGICAAFIGPLSQTILLDINPPEKHTKAMSLWGMAVMIAPICGPMIGGWLTEELNWRWVFYVNIPIGIPTLAILWWLLPSRPVMKRKLDLTGFFLLAVGLAALQLLLDRGQSEDWLQSWEIIIELVIAISATWVFIIHMRTARTTLFHRDMTSNTNFLVATGFMIVMGTVMVALSALLPPMLQNLYGYSVFDTGLLLAPRGFGVLAGMFIATRIVARVDMRILIAVGYFLCAVSLYMMTSWSLEMDWRPIVWAGLVQGFGLGLTFMPVNVMAFATLSPQHRTDGASVLNMMRNVGASAGISLITTVLARNIQTSHQDLAAQVTSYNLPAVDPSSLSERMGDIGGAALRMLDLEINRQAAMIAYLDDFKMIGFIMLLFIPLAYFLKPPKPGSAQPMPMME